jgi:ribonuclease P protein component
MQKDLRLRKSRDFSNVHSVGTSWANDLLVLRVVSNGTSDRSRFGFSVGKRTGNAVVRNKTKRRLREIMRTSHIQGGWDVVVIARAKSGSSSYKQIEKSAMSLLGRANLLLQTSEAESKSQ